MNPDDESVLMAREIFDRFDTHTRLFYALFFVQNTSTQEIARQHHISREIVVDLITKVEKELPEELHYKLVHYLTLALKELEAARDAFCQQYNEALEAHTEELTFAQMIAAHAATPGIMEQAGQFVANDIPFFLETATATGIGVAATSKTFLSSALIALTMPFLWFMSMMLTGKAMGLSLVREAPTLYAKRWLTRQLFLTYSGIIILPILFCALAYCISGIHDKDTIQLYVGIFGTVVFLFVVGYIHWINIRYQKVQNFQEKHCIDYERQRRAIYQGLGVLATLSFMLFVFFASSVFPTLQNKLYAGNLRGATILGSMTVGVGVALFLYYNSGYYLFGELLMISKDEESNQPVTPSAFMLAMKKFYKDARGELTYMWPFIIFTIAPNIIHLVSYRTRPLIACFEIATFIPWWLLVLQRNMKVPQTRWKFILPTFLIMFLAMLLLRLYIYHPYDM